MWSPPSSFSALVRLVRSPVSDNAAPTAVLVLVAVITQGGRAMPRPIGQVHNRNLQPPSGLVHSTGDGVGGAPVPKPGGPSAGVLESYDQAGSPLLLNRSGLGDRYWSAAKGLRNTGQGVCTIASLCLAEPLRW